MTFSAWVAIAAVIGTIYGLIKRYETRLVLLLAGLVMCILSMDPMEAFLQFDKSMTNKALIISICSSMGFAACVTMTKCDLHLVSLLTKPLNKLGVLLLPCCMLVTGVASLAIGSLAGLCAAIGPTLVALMIRAGFRPAIAAAAIISSTLPNYWSPGSTDNILVAQIANIAVMDQINYISGKILLLFVFCVIALTAICFLFGDYKKNGTFQEAGAADTGELNRPLPELPANPNILKAFAPLLPVVLLFVISLWFPQIKMSVATAMLIGFIYVIFVTRSNPAELVKKFFDGMGSGYGNIIGLIIAAGVFAAGLRSCGVVTGFIDYLKDSSEIAKIGGSFGPYILGVMTGSGNAAAFAFCESVVPHAADFGMKIQDLGFLTCLSATLGRVSSPLAAGVILIAGIAGTSPIEVIKRSALVSLGAIVFTIFLM
ncbi:C4-dicarboxylate transporter DcuC [Turicimonas muris]|uniref:C4-dicarboxylate transporter DcuC n=1 Tax=Turicimonas muris TaxID=1796652 RepID=UPI0024955498|nr:C4-dicarboxylate transporter DcuC [Turicimonas muris]